MVNVHLNVIDIQMLLMTSEEKQRDLLLHINDNNKKRKTPKLDKKKTSFVSTNQVNRFHRCH
jgi:hypothetical protein